MDDQLTPAWSFKQQNMAGYITGGHEHGVEITWGADKNPVTRRMCLNLEHYFAKDMSGTFVPRFKATKCSELCQDGCVRIVVDPFEDWRLRSTITYTLLQNCVQAEYTFTFERDYQEFHGLISNYFHEPTEPWIHVGGKWLQPKLTEKEHRTWARDVRTQDIVRGRMAMLNEQPDMPSDQARPVDEQLYDHPVLISAIGDSGWYIVHAVEREMCPSISANRRWNAHDFSLVGRDVAADETVVARAWMIYTRLKSLDDALQLASQLKS